MKRALRGVIALLMVESLCDVGSAQAEKPVCARLGQALYPATDDFSIKRVERMAHLILGPAFARVVREVPWDIVWRGDSSFSQAEYFIQAFEEKLALPELRFAVAAPDPLEIEVELRIDTDALTCVPIEVPGHPNFGMGPSEGGVTIRGPMMVLVTMSAGGISDRWQLPSNKATVGWQREDGKLRAWFDAAGLHFGIAGPRAEAAVTMTMETLRDRRELARWKELLVRSLNHPGRHRADAISILSNLGFQELPGDLWVRLRRLQETGRLRATEIGRLGWLLRPVDSAPEEEATTFTSPASKQPPRLFIAGREFSRWIPVDEQTRSECP